MKSIWIILIGLSITLAACAGVAGQPPAATLAVPSVLGTPTAAPIPPTTTHIPVDQTPAQRAAIANLAQGLGIPAAQISVVSTEAITWPNGCVGVQRIGVLCTMNQVPGFRIILGANGKQYEVHTNQDGSVVAPEQPLLAPDAAEKAAVAQLAKNLGIPASGVKVVSAAVVEWPDSCLGVPQQGVMCAQIVMPGYLFVLEADGRQYEYHSNQDASVIMPASPALTWSEQGGIAGVCQNITVYLSGEVYGQDCKSGDGRMGLLTASQRAQVAAWTDKFSGTMIDLSDPKGAADAMSRTANLLGTGQQTATKDEQRAIFNFGQALYQSLYP